MFLAVDPGNDTGWAVFDEDGRLTGCGLGQGWPVLGVSRAILERPQVYRAGKSKGDPNDLITLAIGLGRYVERLEASGVATVLVLPTTWKGQVPKNVHHPRIKAALNLSEKVIADRAVGVVGERKGENVLDAVGLGKWAFVTGHLARHLAPR
jgi:hypothetical protein